MTDFYSSLCTESKLTILNNVLKDSDEGLADLIKQFNRLLNGKVLYYTNILFCNESYVFNRLRTKRCSSQRLQERTRESTKRYSKRMTEASFIGKLEGSKVIKFV